ncbi:hypothetical protein [Arvimicrobium flavum]|uniref:hypothetical protein n=1 Tax=Arvimicrobium flavum TaxID=3393320 RepID=UPI00237BC9EA|nr:hypothetical protein [Mesorhizobium shangrilense]
MAKRSAVTFLRGWPANRFEAAADFLRQDRNPEAAAGVARHFSRTCLAFPLHAWRYRRSAGATAHGLASLLAMTGRYDEAARLLGNPFVFMLVRPGDGRWLEILKPVIDLCGNRRRRRLRFLFSLVRKRSVIAWAMWCRAGGQEAAWADFETFAADPGIPPSALPYVLETTARRLPMLIAERSS